MASNGSTETWTLDGSSCTWIGLIGTDAPRLVAVVIFYVVALTIIISNFALLLAILPHRKLRTPINILLVSNSVCDFCVGLYVIPIGVTLWMLCWQYSDARICSFLYATKEYFIATTMAHMAIIAVHRYIRVMHPSYYRDHFKRKTCLLVTLCWIVPSTTSYIRIFIPRIFEIYPFDKGTSGRNVYDRCTGYQSVLRTYSCVSYSQKGCSCVLCFSQASTVVESIFQYLIPIATMLGCYGRIMVMGYWRAKKFGVTRERLQSARALHGRGSQQSEQLQFGRTNSFFILRIFRTPEYRGVRVFLVIMVMLLLSWSPHFVTRFLEAVGSNGMTPQQMKEAVSSFTEQVVRLTMYILGFANAVLNPLILFCMNESYRAALRKSLSCLLKKRILSSHQLVLPDSQWNEMAQALESGGRN